MNTLKSMLMVVVLGVVVYGVYSALTKDNSSLDENSPWADAPAIELPDGTTDITSLTQESMRGGPGGVASGATNRQLRASDAPRYSPSASVGASTVPPPQVQVGAGSPPSISPPLGGATQGATTLNTQAPAATAAEPGDVSFGTQGGNATVPEQQLAPSESIVTAPTPARDDVHGEFEAAMQTVYGQLSAGNLDEAHLALSAWYEEPSLAPADRQQLIQLLDQVAGTVIYSRQTPPHYQVQPGDTLEGIANRYNVPWQLLARINGIGDPAALHAGDRLKVVEGPFSAVVDLDEYLLTMFWRDRYAGRFRIGIGQDHSTPLGEFEVRTKLVNPTYYRPGGGVVDKNDPNNPLGEFWIDLGDHLGIHGTIDPSSIGRAASRGCIRLDERDVEDLFGILSIGSKVTIRR